MKTSDVFIPLLKYERPVGRILLLPERSQIGDIVMANSGVPSFCRVQSLSVYFVHKVIEEADREGYQIGIVNWTQPSTPVIMPDGSIDIVLFAGVYIHDVYDRVTKEKRFVLSYGSDDGRLNGKVTVTTMDFPAWNLTFVV